jgi:hypothetical protein
MSAGSLLRMELNGDTDQTFPRVRTALNGQACTERIPIPARTGRPHPFHPSAGKPGGDAGVSGWL